MSLFDHQNIALFGGTFDPVHIGHIQAAHYVQDQCDLSSILFIPAPHPPHKKAPCASFAHRCEMLKIALHNEPGMHISRIEQEYPGPSYTAKTVQRLIDRHANNTFFLIVGADSLLDIPQWYDSEKLLGLVHLIVVGREDQVAAKRLEETIATFSPLFSFDVTAGVYRSKNKTTITLLDSFKWTASSSAVRTKLQQGIRPQELSEAVYVYIKKNNLYL